MAITPAQKAAAEERQWQAARDTATQVRIVAGPGTGKSRTIEKRVAHLLENGAEPDELYVISFTRATCAELRDRIQSFCADRSCGSLAPDVRVSTMHSFALRILRRANLLTSYPSTPIILDTWEQKNVYDGELASVIGCTPGRAAEIRLAHDARWQTLDPQYVNQAEITRAERRGFNAFHISRTNLYSCVLPGEVIFKCVDALRSGALNPSRLPPISHLVVDEFQDLNACDQEFIRLLAAQSAVLFIAGDDDQSIYSFRHANPDGIVQFPTTYPSSRTHVLTDCFRCAPAIASAASRLIEYNPNREPKTLNALYAQADPPVQGQVLVWSFRTARAEARVIAESCRELINAGMAGREDEILVLISNRRVQLDLLRDELRELNIPFEPPPGASLIDRHEPIRAVYSILRIARDQTLDEDDYPAHRDLLALLSGVGLGTAKAIGDACIENNQNYRNLFYLPTLPSWLPQRAARAAARIAAVAQAASTWALTDTVAERTPDIAGVLENHVFTSGRNSGRSVRMWNRLAELLPDTMTLEELIQFLGADTEADQRAVFELASQRTESEHEATTGPETKRIRILTTHGAKGLTGKIVFIPSVEQGIMPSFRALQATGLVIENRRLFYVSVTRAMACCIISHAIQHTGSQAQVLRQQSVVQLTRSQFLSEMEVNSTNRTSGLSVSEATEIVSQVNSL